MAVVCLSGLTFDMYHCRNVLSGLDFSVGTCPQEACRGFQKYVLTSVFVKLHSTQIVSLQSVEWGFWHGIKKVIADFFFFYNSKLIFFFSE